MTEIYTNLFFLSALIPAIFSWFTAALIYRMEGKSPATIWLMSSFLFMGVFYCGYVPAFASLDPAASYHRWFTILGLGGALTTLSQFLLMYPTDLAPRARRVLFVLQSSLWLALTLWFAHQSLDASRSYRFLAQAWDFDLETLSARYGIVYLAYIAVLLPLSLVRLWRRTPADTAAGLVGLLFFSGTIVPGFTNIISRDGGISRDVHQIIMVLTSLPPFFAALILYINTTSERTTFMTKIVGVSVVTFLLLFQFIAYFAMQDQETAYDQARDADVDLYLGGGRPTARVAYVNRYEFSTDLIRGRSDGVGLNQTLHVSAEAAAPPAEVNLPEGRNALVLALLEARANRAKPPNAVFVPSRFAFAPARLLREPTALLKEALIPSLNASPAGNPGSEGRLVVADNELSALLARFEHPHFRGYRGLILLCAGLPPGPDGEPTGLLSGPVNYAALLDCIAGARRPVLILENKIRRMENATFRADLLKHLTGLKGQLRPFANAIARHVASAKEEGADLKLEVLPFVAPMQPAGTRLYRMHTSKDLNADPFTAFLHVDLDKSTVYEAGFSYRAYRAFIHPTALKLTLILAIGLLVILVGYRIFFAGALLAPLQQLLDGVRRVNQGELDAKVPVKVADEIGFISESFNSMLDTIRDARDNLERKVSDRTEELQGAYDKLKEMDGLKTNFFANVSHELRTPLTLMLTPLESMLEGDLGAVPAGQREFLLSAHRNGQKLLKLINNLLDFSKLEAGRVSVAYRELDFVDYVKGLTAAFDSAARSAGLELSVVSQRDKLVAFFDPEKMEKVVLNLLSNAFKFTDHGGIYVEISEEQGEVLLRVRDTGIGIPADKLATIFERFSQVDGSASRKYEGTGIGLALARELALVHRGSLEAEPATNGASFLLRFPRVPEEMLAGRSESPAGQAESGRGLGLRSSTRAAVLAELHERQSVRLGNEEESIEIVRDRLPVERSSETVLIVEDTHDMRKLLYFLLSPYYRLLTARNGREGLEKARRHRPNLILSDIMMPEMNGYELTAAVKADPKLREIPVVLLSAKADVGMRIQGLEQGADDYVVKPFNSAELTSRVRGQLRIQQMHAEIAQMRDRLQELNEKLEGQVQVQVSELLLSEKFRNYLPPQLVESILARQGDSRVRSERKKLSIFFSDIVDFTRITDELEPEELAKLLNDYLSEMTRIAQKYDAVIDKFIGDALLAHFGALRSAGEKQDALAAVAMAVEMQLRMRELSAQWIEQGFSEPLQIRAGIATGYAAVGNFGSDQRVDYTIIGSQVNLASRIQTAALPGEILISHATWVHVNREMRTEPAGDIQPKGFQRSFPVYRVLI